MARMECGSALNFIEILFRRYGRSFSFQMYERHLRNCSSLFWKLINFPDAGEKRGSLTNSLSTVYRCGVSKYISAGTTWAPCVLRLLSKNVDDYCLSSSFYSYVCVWYIGDMILLLYIMDALYGEIMSRCWLNGARLLFPIIWHDTRKFQNSLLPSCRHRHVSHISDRVFGAPIEAYMHWRSAQWRSTLWVVTTKSATEKERKKDRKKKNMQVRPANGVAHACTRFPKCNSMRGMRLIHRPRRPTTAIKAIIVFGARCCWLSEYLPSETEKWETQNRTNQYSIERKSKRETAIAMRTTVAGTPNNTPNDRKYQFERG